MERLKEKTNGLLLFEHVAAHSWDAISRVSVRYATVTKGGSLFPDKPII